MKKLNLQQKLSLNKETVTKLNDAQMSKINGGGTLSLFNHCHSSIRHITCGASTSNNTFDTSVI